MWTADFSCMELTQTCHDPECRLKRFRGKPISLPQDLQDQLQDALLDHALSQLNETDLINNKDSSNPSTEEFYDEEIEKAMLALHINEITPTKGNKSTQQDIKATPSSELDKLKDDALLEAANLHPELFP